jgi:hypothetical protein
LKIALIETGVDVGPAIYLARIFDTDVDSVVKFFIFILIFVFDPMAVMFVISYNVTLQDKKEEIHSEDLRSDTNVTISDSNIPKPKKKWPVYGEKKEVVEEIEVGESKKKMVPLERGAFSRKS